MKERTKLAIILAVFAAAWYLPAENARVIGAIQEALLLVRWYAREHVILCLIPAFFIAGAITVFLNQGAVMKYLGPAASKLVAYPVAAVSGTVLAVCSCTVLPIFGSIHKRGAGLGPAFAFLYAGPAINILAVILTARVLGIELGIARAVSAILFAVLIGLSMHLIFRREEAERGEAAGLVAPTTQGGRPIWQDAVLLAAMIGVLVFANWGRPAEGTEGVWAAIHSGKWVMAGIFGLVIAVALPSWFSKSELGGWVDSSWGYAKQILPLLLAGVFVAGLLLGGPDSSDAGLIPNTWVERMVGGNSIQANLFAAVAGALMYFATLTEVPILEGLIASGMGKGPALTLLLAGPALSLPNMLVIASFVGAKKTIVYIAFVVLYSSVAGMIYGALF